MPDGIIQKSAPPLKKALFVQRSEPLLLREKVVVMSPGVELGGKLAYEVPVEVENCSVVPLANWTSNCPL